MSRYSCTYLQGLKKETDLKQYNDKLDEVVSTISKAVLSTASRGNTKLILKTKVIPPLTDGVSSRNFSWGPDTLIVYDSMMIDKVIDKLKMQFFDSHIEYVESKDVSGNIINSAIRIKWDEITSDEITSDNITSENIESRTQKEIQDENIKNGLARRKRIIDDTNKKIQELEDEIAVKRALVKKLSGFYVL